MIDTSKGFALQRTLAVPPEKIWAAWTEPDAVAQWWHPGGTSTPREEVHIDARVGGSYGYTMVNNAAGKRVVTAGVYRELTPFERLVFTRGEPHSDPDETPVVTLTLQQIAEGTSLTFDLRGVGGAPGDGFFYDGWRETLDSLADYLA